MPPKNNPYMFEGGEKKEKVGAELAQADTFSWCAAHLIYPVI